MGHAFCLLVERAMFGDGSPAATPRRRAGGRRRPAARGAAAARPARPARAAKGRRR
jgi:hypothetical protein